MMKNFESKQKVDVDSSRAALNEELSQISRYIQETRQLIIDGLGDRSVNEDLLGQLHYRRGQVLNWIDGDNRSVGRRILDRLKLPEY